MRWLIGSVLGAVMVAGSVGSAMAQGGDQLLIRAYNCETDPGSIGMLPPPDDCADAAGVTIVVTTEDGGAVGSCVTDENGACTVRVPLGTTIVLAEDVSTLPAGYAPKANPQVRQTPPSGAAGEFISEFINVRQPVDDGTDDGGTVTVYRTACPPGYAGDDYFADCFGNPVAGAEFAIGTAGTGNVATDVTGAAGFVTFPLDPYLLGQATGRVGVGEVAAGADAPPVVACTKNGGDEVVPFEPSEIAIAPVGPFFAVEFAAEAGDEIRCDWYGIPAGSAPTPDAGDDEEFVSGGIGLTRAAWEEEHGAGEAVEVVSPIHDEVYAYEDGTYYAAFEGSKADDESVVVYLEVVWDGDGVTFEEAQEVTEALLPTDAEVTESPYEAPPTPGGSVALRAWRYASPTLGTVPYGGTTTLPPEILVVFHLTHTDKTPAGGDQQVIATTVTRVSILTRLPEG